MTSVAGCTDAIGRGMTVETWLPSPRVIDRDGERYFFRAISPDSMEGFSEDLDRTDWENTQDSVRELYGRPRVSEVTQQIQAGPSRFRFEMVDHEVDIDIVERDLRDGGFQFVWEHEDYEVYEHEDSPELGVAVQDGRYIDSDVRGSQMEDAETLLRRVIDTSEGSEETYTEAEPVFEEVLGELTQNYYFWGNMHESPEETDVSRGRFTGHISTGVSIDLDSPESIVTTVLGFESDGDFFERDIEDWTREETVFDDLRDIQVEPSGRLAIIEGSIPTREVLDWIPQYP